MSDTTRRHAPDERVPPTTSDLLVSTATYAQNKNSNTAQTLAHVTKEYDAHLPTYPTSTQPKTQPDPQTLLNQLANALDSSDESIRTLINHLPSTWQATNPKGATLTKTMLQRSSWGELRVADDLQALQQAILMTHPPLNHTVTQYTTYTRTSNYAYILILMVPNP